MKKLLAVILAVLMLGSITAFADSATVFTVSDPTVSVNMGGEDMSIDLAGLTLAAGGLMDGEMPTLALNLLGGGELMFAGAFRYLGDRVLINIEGLSNTYYVTVPENTIPSTVQNIDIESLNIDVEALTNLVLNSVELGTDGDAMTFKVPYTAINEAIEMILPALSEVEIPGVDVAELAQQFAEIKASDSGINLEGSIRQSETGVAVNVKVFLVQGGQASEAPVAMTDVAMDQTETEMSFKMDTYVANEETASLVKALSVNMNVTDVVVIDIDVMDGYGVMHCSYDLSTGLFTLNLVAEGFDFTLTCVVGVVEGDVVVPAAGDPASAIDILEMTEEQSSQAMGELMQAAGGLIEFLTPVLSQLGA